MGDVPGSEEDDPVVLAARIFNEHGSVIARDSDWPQPFKHFTFPDRNLHVQHDAEKISIKADKPVKALWFQNADVTWSDNCLDVIPGDEQTITATGLSGTVEWLYYGMNN